MLNSLFNVIFYSLLGIYVLLIIIFLSIKKNVKIINIVFVCCIVIYGVLRICFLGITLDQYSSLSEWGIYVSTAVILAVILVLGFVFDKKNKVSSTKTIAYAGICIALAYALSFIKIEFLGGSVTLASAIPIIIYSYIFGSKRGIFAGIIFGILQFIQKATVYHPVQALLDYPIAFGAIGLSGIFDKTKLKPIIKFILGSIVGLMGRYVSHVLSGYFVFGTFAGYYNFSSPILYSLVYNMNVLIDLGITLIVGVILFSSKTFVKETEKIK